MKKEAPDPKLETQVGGKLGMAFGRVRPSMAFRQRLSNNLQLAARHKATGEPVIEDVSAMQRSIIIAAGAIGLIAAMTAVVVYFHEGRRRGSRAAGAARAEAII